MDGSLMFWVFFWSVVYTAITFGVFKALKMSDTFIAVSCVSVFIGGWVIGSIWVFLICLIVAMCLKFSDKAEKNSVVKHYHHYHNDKEDK